MGGCLPPTPPEDICRQKMNMARNGWHIERDEDRLTLARRLPVRFDIVVDMEFPLMSCNALARQIRQDMWRALQGQRGFSPVVEVTRLDGGLHVRAGGQVDARRYAKSALEGRISEVLGNPKNRTRWVKFATGKRAA